MVKITIKFATLSVFFLLVLSSFIASGIDISKEIECKNVKILPVGTSYKKPLSTKEILILKQKAESEKWTYDVGENSATKSHIDQLCGFVPPSNLNHYSNSNLNLQTSYDLPDSFDWRDPQGQLGADWDCTTPIRDQGACGSCWAFATVGILESNILIHDNDSVDLSEQWLVSCNQETLENGDPWGCAGGNFTANDYHSGERKGKCGGYGAVLESDFRYVASSDEPCNGPYNHPYAIDSWSYICQNDSPIEQIKQAIYDYGPVAAAVYVSTNFTVYNGGIFNSSDKDPIYPDAVNHGVLIVIPTNNQYTMIYRIWIYRIFIT
jgi:C1A family cysteine protease